ncbi:hypothetical protein [Fictibacillus gelatini]|uniref:hypothetical protein n=1 Tax=Fictibacillus gelatini TaxID=225985 RepID=UPI00040C2C36|nr:hypothetical protein [Fictibacillus gelatini]
MSIEERFFNVDGQWNVIHLPKKPSGFGVMILGDLNHFVDEKTSLWKQNERLWLIQHLRNRGYTCFYSNLYGRNWGSPKAITLAKRLYHHVIKSEILNPKIHLLAEGMGALVALKLMEEMQGNIRSCLLINPCLDLKGHFYQMKLNRLFYKQTVKEIGAAYGIANKNVEPFVETLADLSAYQSAVPVKIWHAASGVQFPFKVHSRKYEEIRYHLHAPIELSIHLPEKRLSLGNITDFYKLYEKEV